MAAAMLLVEGEHLEFHGFRLFASRDPKSKCDFCRHATSVEESPVVSFLSERSRDDLIQMHAQMHICVGHMRELAELAERALESKIK